MTMGQGTAIAAGVMPAWRRWDVSVAMPSQWIVYMAAAGGCAVLACAIVLMQGMLASGIKGSEQASRDALHGGLRLVACIIAGMAAALLTAAVAPQLLTGLGLYARHSRLLAVLGAVALLLALLALAGVPVAARSGLSEGRKAAPRSMAFQRLLLLMGLAVFALAFFGMLLVADNWPNDSPPRNGFEMDGQTVVAIRCGDGECRWIGEDDIARATGIPVALKHTHAVTRHHGADDEHEAAWADAGGNVHLQGWVRIDPKGFAQVLDEAGDPLPARPASHLEDHAFRPKDGEDTSRRRQDYAPASGRGPTVGVLQSSDRQRLEGEVVTGGGPSTRSPDVTPVEGSLEVPWGVSSVLDGLVSNSGYAKAGDGLRRVLVMRMGGLRLIVRAPANDAPWLELPAFEAA